MSDLNNLVAAGPWELRCADDINADGWIMGPGVREGHSRAVLLVPRCAADLDGSGTVDFGDLLVVLGAWGRCT